MISNQQSTNQVTATINQFQDFFDIYDKIVPYLSIDDAKKGFIEKRRSWIHRLNSGEFPVAFLGSYSAGKSTIINGIIGREVLPEATKSTTAFPTIIRKGSKDKASVYYIDEDTKMSVWNQLSKEIGLKIDKNLQLQPEEKIATHLQRIEAAINEYESNGTKIDRTAFEKSKKLLSGWGNQDYKKTKEITLEQLNQYVEGHQDSIYIDSIEVFLKNIDIPDDIVLVDLPGLGVDNQRHVEFTKQYIRDKAKAFVVCMKPKSLLDGEEITFLDETSRNNPTILQRAFWIVNQWDTLNEQQRKEEEETFQEKVGNYNFNINNDRYFKVSALNYLILKCVANETILQQPKLKNHLSNLKKSGLIVDDPNDISPQKAQDLLSHREIAPFSEFCKSLFDYLNKKAKDEFLNDAKQELLQAIRNLEQVTKPLSDSYRQSANPALEISGVEINRQLKSFLSAVTEKIRAFAKSNRNSEYIQLWRQSDTHRITDEIDKRILKINREELTNRLMRGKDIAQGMMSRLPSILEDEIQLTSLLREQMIVAIDSFFVKSLDKLLTEIEIVDPEKLPEDVIRILEDRLSRRDISMRLKGVADALFHIYGKEVDKIGSELYQSQGDTSSDRLEQALKKYKDGMYKLTNTLSNELNYSMRLSIKNHSEDLEQELINLFDNASDSITKQIARNINIDATVAAETKKQTAIADGYKKLIELKLAIMGNITSDIIPEEI
jgi:GTPase Era involved in 16S rRNA processing/exonuclease VII small subunit